MIEIIRRRHRECCETISLTDWEPEGGQAHVDRAELIRIVDALAAELEKAKQAMKVQASAVKTLQAAEDLEINVLRAKSTEAYRATATLDSERAMNATLTEEVERLTAELAAERARRVEVEGRCKALSYVHEGGVIRMLAFLREARFYVDPIVMSSAVGLYLETVDHPTPPATHKDTQDE